jgi:hypothetical protein
MVCRENHGSPDSGGALLRLKTDSCEANLHTILPLFLREVGRYYWDAKTAEKEYKKPGRDFLDTVLCNMHTKMFRFAPLGDPILDVLLCYASAGGYLETVHYILKKGADINSFNGLLALGFASRNGHFPVVKFLVQKGVDINSSKAIPLASLRRHFEIVEFLVKNGKKDPCNQEPQN